MRIYLTLLTLLLQLFLKYARTLDGLIHHLVHMEFSNDPLPILLNHLITENLNEVKSIQSNFL